MTVFNTKAFSVYYLIEICLFLTSVYDFYDKWHIVCVDFALFLKKNKKWIKYVTLWLNIEIYINLYQNQRLDVTVKWNDIFIRFQKG